MINQQMTPDKRSRRVEREGFDLFQINWTLLADKQSADKPCNFHVTLIDLTEDYNNFSGRFSSHHGANMQSLVSVGWNAAIDDWNDFNPDDILDTVEVQRLESILTGRVEILYEVGGRPGDPGERIDGLGLMRCCFSFSERQDCEAWRKQ